MITYSEWRRTASGNLAVCRHQERRSAKPAL